MLDEANGFFFYKDKRIDLTFGETCILRVLIRDKNLHTSIDELKKRTHLKTSNIRVLIYRLNRKLKGILWIRSLYSIGYKIEYMGE